MWLLRLLSLTLTSISVPAAEIEFPDIKLTKLAFGSCHSRHAFYKRRNKESNTNHQVDHTIIINNNKTIWDAITDYNPQTFLWTGDAVYLKRKKGDGSVDELQEEYSQMLNDRNLGYRDFIDSLKDETKNLFYIDGVWDDHDYGGNDRGNEMESRSHRQQAYLDFLNMSNNNNNDSSSHKPSFFQQQRNGLYHSVSFGRGSHKVNVLFLDTRYHRDRHGIPSIATWKIPLAAPIACVIRWISAGFNWFSNYNGTVLGKEQWDWLTAEIQQAKSNDSQVNIVVSSIQVITTNPAVESWGHFDIERTRLIKALSELNGVLILSGDVHYAELLSNANNGLLEVTSSGLTHACEEPFYGPLCTKILDNFDRHRLYSSSGGGNDRATNYYTKRNFGTIDFDWGDIDNDNNGGLKGAIVRIRDESGRTQLSAPIVKRKEHLLMYNHSFLPKVIDGHLIPLFYRVLIMFTLTAYICFKSYSKIIISKGNKKSKHE